MLYDICVPVSYTHLTRVSSDVFRQRKTTGNAMTNTYFTNINKMVFYLYIMTIFLFTFRFKFTKICLMTEL